MGSCRHSKRRRRGNLSSCAEDDRLGPDTERADGDGWRRCRSRCVKHSSITTSADQRGCRSPRPSHIRPLTNAGAEHRRTGRKVPLGVFTTRVWNQRLLSPPPNSLLIRSPGGRRSSSGVRAGVDGRAGCVRSGRRAERCRLCLSLRRTRRSAHRLSGSSWPSSSTRRYRAMSCAWSGTLGALVAMNAEVATLAARSLPARGPTPWAARSLIVALAGEGLPT